MSKSALLLPVESLTQHRVIQASILRASLGMHPLMVRLDCGRRSAHRRRMSIVKIFVPVLASIAFGLTGNPVTALSGPSYSEEVAKRMLAFASFAYCHGPNNDYKPKAGAVWNVTASCAAMAAADTKVVMSAYNASLDAYGVLLASESEQTIVIAFKGTDPHHFVDWTIDLRSVRTYTNRCDLGALSLAVHSGFCEYYHGVKSMGLIDALVALHDAHPTWVVYASGHSLGGAAVMLAAVELMWSYRIPVTTYTFGSPRVGTGSFSNFTSQIVEGIKGSTLFRVTHYEDVIPHMPPCHWEGYDGDCIPDTIHPYHTGSQVHYPEDMSASPKFCADVDGKDCWEGFWQDTSVTDHLTYFGEAVSHWCCPEGVGDAMPFDGEELQDELRSLMISANS